MVHMGSFVERDETGRLFNTSVLLGPTAAILATYRKVHLFGFGEGEPKLMTPGTVSSCTTGSASRPATTCASPSMFRRCSTGVRGSLLLVSAWPAKRIAHWRLLAQARAVENQSYVVACNTAGTHAGVPMGGNSMVVDPWGVVLAEAGRGEEVLTVDLDLDPSAAPGSFPVLADRRL